MTLKRSRPTLNPRNNHTSSFQRYTCSTARVTILEVNEMTKLHKRDTTSSYDEFLRYAQRYKLILTTSTLNSVNNKTLNLYFKGKNAVRFFYERRPTTTKLTLIDLPSSIDHSTFHECSKGILCLAPTYHQRPLTRPVVIISYSLRLGRKSTLPSTSTIRWKTERESTPKRLIYSTSRSGTTFQVGIQSSNSLIKSTQKLLVPASTSTSKSSTLIRRQIPTFLRPTFTMTQVTSSYDTYTMALATQTTPSGPIYLQQIFSFFCATHVGHIGFVPELRWRFRSIIL